MLKMNIPHFLRSRSLYMGSRFFHLVSSMDSPVIGSQGSLWMKSLSVFKPVASEWRHLNLKHLDIKNKTRYSGSSSLYLGSRFFHLASSMDSPVTRSQDSLSMQSLSILRPVVSVEWLRVNLNHLDIKVVDTSWYMPAEQRNSLQEYQVAHIPGALFFSIDFISDQTTKLPHMLPSEDAFAAAVTALGIENKDRVIVYDGKGIFSAARVWWMFRVFGHDRVWVLDGGLPKWRASGFDVESSASSDAIFKASAASEAVENVYKGQNVGPFKFQTRFQQHLVWTMEQVKRNIEDNTHQHLDARSQERFVGLAPEPWKGLKSGHIPGTKCIPFPRMLDDSQLLLSEDELKKRFEEAGICLDRPVVASCGTGVTACILALGLHRLGNVEVAVYDGSWTEWGAEPDTPMASSSSSSSV